MIQRELIRGAAAAFDRAVTKAAQARGRRSRPRGASESLTHHERLDGLARLAAPYEDALADATWVREPQLIAPRRRAIRGWTTAEIHDLRWASSFEPLVEAIAPRYLRQENNLEAVARVFRHREPRPAVVLIHGYLGGQQAFEEKAWPTRWLFDELGLDLAFFVLPFHGPRRRKDGPPAFPSSDPRVTVEGFRQAVTDLRDLIHWLRTTGSPSVGVMGMSLGGYTTALAATVEPELAFAVPVIPLASIAAFAREQGRLDPDPHRGRLEEDALERVHARVSPLQRRLAIDPERVLVVAAEADRITPKRHAERIAEHFEAPLTSFPGGHLLQFGRGQAFRHIGRHLGRLGVTAPRRSDRMG